MTYYGAPTCPLCGIGMQYKPDISQTMYCPRCSLGQQDQMRQQQKSQNQKLKELFDPPKATEYNFPIKVAIEHGHQTQCPTHGLQGTTVYGGCVVCMHSYDGYREQLADWLKRTKCRCEACLRQMHHGVEELERLALQGTKS